MSKVNERPDLSAYGWAPGYYIVGCIDCGRDNIVRRNYGAKGSTRCAEHAILAYEEWEARGRVEAEIDRAKASAASPLLAPGRDTAADFRAVTMADRLDDIERRLAAIEAHLRL